MSDLHGAWSFLDQHRNEEDETPVLGSSVVVGLVLRGAQTCFSLAAVQVVSDLDTGTLCGRRKK